MVRNNMKRISGILFAMTFGAGMMTGCGDGADFAGTAKRSSNATPKTPVIPPKPPVEPPPEEKPTLPEPYAGLTWFWQCTNAPVTVPDPDSEEYVVVEGTGPHEFEKELLRDTPITFSGNLCPPEAMARDIVFVVDLSGSMNGSDPYAGGTCGRLQAIETVISSIPEGDARYGVVTFSDNSNPMNNSLALHGTRDELFADLGRSGRVVSDIICADGGSTNYQDGLVKARDLLMTGDLDATKEIYFISDGRPDGGRTGEFEASQMKAPGLPFGSEYKPVTIATVMLGNNDQILEQKIASRIPDENGNPVPLHAYVAGTNQLAETLAVLSHNEIEEGSLKVRPINDSNWTELDLLTHLNDITFTLPSYVVDIENAPYGIEVYYSYRDSHNNLYESGGQILWVEDTE